MRSHLRSPPLTALVLAALISGPAFAQPSSSSSDGDGLVRALTACRALADAARLACFDSAVARLSAAQAAGEVVVVDRATVRAARRQAFGFNLPSLDLFGRGEQEPAVNEVQLVLASAGRAGDGKWILRTNNGQVWRQTDANRLNTTPRNGSKAEVRRGALGSYFMKVDGQKSIRVRREQ